MRSKLLRYGLLMIVAFGILLSLGDHMNGVYKLGGDAEQVRSYVLSGLLVLGLALLVLFFVKSVLTILFIVLLAGLVFILLHYGFMNFF